MIKAQRFDGTFSFTLMFGLLPFYVANAEIPNDFLGNSNRAQMYSPYQSSIAPGLLNFSGCSINPTGVRIEINTPKQTGSDIGAGRFTPPRTELARMLLKYRKAAIDEGMKLLSAEEIDTQIKEGRGSIADKNA